MAGANDKGLVVSGGSRIAYGGLSGPVYDNADANAGMAKWDMEPGSATDVPVVLFGIDIMGADLGMFDGRTEPAVGVVDLDGDSAVTLGFTSDDVATIILGGNATLVLPASQLGAITFADETVDIGTTTIGLNDLHFGLGGIINFDGGDITITHTANTLTVAGLTTLALPTSTVLDFGSADVTLTHAANKLTLAGGDLHVADGFGVVIGHSAQVVTVGGIPEFQVLGTTGGVDGGMAVGAFSADATPAQFTFIKGRGAIGATTIVQDNDVVGRLHYAAADGTDLGYPIARLDVEVDDASPAANAIGGAYVFYTATTGGVSTERLRIDSSGTLAHKGTTTNGQAWNLKTVTGTHSTASGTGTETISNVIPAGAIVLGVTTRVTTILAGTSLTTWSIGISGDTDRWGTGIALAADTTTTGTAFAADVQPTVYPSATSIVLTAAAGQFDSGVVRYTIHYYDFTAATS